MNIVRLRDALVQCEGMKLKPYRDTLGVLTIGVGRNLEDVGISRGEALYLLENDIAWAYESATRKFPWFQDLNDVRQEVVMNMIFNLGMTRLLGFEGMLKAMDNEDYALASVEMLDSSWATQTGDRAKLLAQAMRSGQFTDPGA